MPPKKKHKRGGDADEEGKKILTKTKDIALCSIITPGPKYQLKTLVGYKDHCISKFRNPAYSFSRRHPIVEVEKSPGPKYIIKERRVPGFTFGHVAKYPEIVGPGPKYRLPDVSHGPFFSIKWRTKPRKIFVTPGPYYVKPILDAPAFSLGLRTVTTKPIVSPGPYSPYNLNVVKLKAPMYTIAGRRPLQFISESPGPIYNVKPSKPTPAFSFGVKHSVCAPPYITECDAKC